MATNMSNWQKQSSSLINYVVYNLNNIIKYIDLMVEYVVDGDSSVSSDKNVMDQRK